MNTMAGQPSVDSLLLSDVLDTLCMSPELVAFRIATYKKMQKAVEFIKPLGYPTCIYTGSQPEGGTMPIMQSDFDIMYPMPTKLYSVTERIHSGNSWANLDDGVKLLMQTENVHSGFVKLKRIGMYGMDVRLSNMLHMLPGGDIVRYKEIKGSYFLLSESVQNQWQRREDGLFGANGPCLNVLCNLPEYPSGDMLLFCLRCHFWPSQANEWLTRERNFQFPSTQQIKEAAAEGCLLAPIGFPGSPNEDIEWRISFSVIERDLLWLWNNIQLKCYVFMKLILKRLVEAAVPNIICSYHLKTFMFWQIEVSDSEMWKPENFSSCGCLVHCWSG